MERLVVQVMRGDDDDEKELHKVTRTLRAELLRLDVEDVELLQQNDVPEGAKGLSAIAGWLAIWLNSVAELRNTVGALRDWTTRSQRTVEVTFGADGSDTLKVTGVSSARQDEIITAFLNRHVTSA